MMSILDGIIGCWSPSLGASGYRLLDRTRYGNHGTLTNMDAGTDWVAIPPRGMALDFDGTDDYVDCGVNNRGASAISVSAWVIPQTTTGSHPFVGKYNFAGGTAANRSWVLGQNGTSFRASIYSTDGTFGTRDSGAFVVAGAISHVMMTWKSDGVTGAFPSLFVNGVEVTGTTSGVVQTLINTNSVTTKLGRIDNFASVAYANCKLMESALWNRDLTLGEIEELNRLGNGWIGRELTGMNRRRRAYKGPSFNAAWALRQRQILGGGGGLG